MVNKLKLIGYCGLILGLWLTPELINQNRQGFSTVLTQDVNTSRQLLQQGIELYRQQSFAAALNFWQQSASLSAQQQDNLTQALALNNIAQAQQKLGEWESAQKAIARSFELLESDNLAQQPGYWEILAKVYNTQGNYQFKTGKVELALTSWQDAAKYYLRANHNSGIVITQINQAQALQYLGFTARATDILTSLESSLQLSDSQQKTALLRNLGIGLRNLGRLEKSALVLEQSIDSAPQSDRGLSWLELGNTRQQQGDRAQSIGKVALAQNYYAQAMEAYKQTAENESDSVIALLNQFSLLVKTEKHTAAEKFAADFQFPQLRPNRDRIYAQLNYARSLTCQRFSPPDLPICNQQPLNTLDTLNQTSGDRYSSIIDIINRAILQARTINDPISEAEAIGQLAEIYELQGDYESAQDLNQQALLLLEGKSAANIAYRLEWQQGRIFKQQENISAATVAYSQAIASLEQVRANILFVDPSVQFSVRDRVEQVYREYADLLLRTSDNNSPSQDNLRGAIEAIDALQLAELENYLGCDLSQLIKLDRTTVDTTAAQVYPIILGDRLVTIIDVPNQPLAYREVQVSRSQITTTLNTLQNNLTQSGKTPEVLIQGEQLYEWIIAPLEPILAANPQLETLVFVPDSLLRNIPFAVLYDGQEYLLEKDYAVTVSPQLELFAPAPTNEPLKVLTGGVAISQTIEGIDFSNIAQVEKELTQIATEVNTSEPLINRDFTEANIEQKLQRADFSAIHWKTHGVFSSDPEETFLVAYQDSIKADELQSLVQTASQGGQKPLELLVLSACETAKGDNRAILGLAGLTVRTGARTALSTLWRADDRATTLLMTKFYQQLSLGDTKAQALKKAQLSLLKEEGYIAPYYWGTYILVGNWL